MSYYRYLLGIPAEEYYSMRLGQFLDIVLCYQIHNGIAEAAKKDTRDLDEVMIP